MTTSEPSVETRRQIAESIARRGIPYSWLNNEDEYKAALNWFANEIEAALKERDERAAKICEAGAMLASPDGVIPQGDPEHERLKAIETILTKAATAIRKETS